MPIKFGTDARARLAAGVEILGRTVAGTLGPAGRNVAIEKAFGDPLITKDGVSVASEVHLHDKFENMGASLLREVASKTSDDAGDGTTTATVLGRYIFREGMKLVEAGVDPMSLKRGMDLAVVEVVEEVLKASLPIKGPADIENVATISANGDRTLGQVIAECVAKVGTDGVINIEEGRGLHTEVETVEGMQFDRGWVNLAFGTQKSNAESSDLNFEDVRILVTDLKVGNPTPLIPMLEVLVEEKASLIIIAPDFEDAAISTFVQNLRSLPSCLVKAPGFGAKQVEILGDIAALTGATLLTKDLGHNFDDIFKEGSLETLGVAGHVKITAKSTTIMEGAGSEQAIDERITQIKAQIASSGSEYDQDKLKDRLGKLQGGICLIQVGAATEVEMKELKARLEDALYATRASIESGVVAGGGTALIRAAQIVQGNVSLAPVGDTLYGFNLVLDACSSPLQQIIRNAGGSGDVYVHKVQEAVVQEGNQFMGIDASKRNLPLVNMVDSGILDPCLITQRVIINAVSAVGTMLTTECMLHKPDRPTPATPDSPQFG